MNPNSPPSSIPATRLLAALLDMAGLTDIVLTQQQLAKIADDELEVLSRASDHTLGPDDYRLVVHRRRSPIIVPGHLLPQEIR
jgi:hypothetical protein